MKYIGPKRLFDIFGSLTALILLFPAFLAFLLVIKMTSKGPVLYRGIRVGMKGRPFKMLKFRTMVVNAEKLGASSTAEDDPRITPIGRFLRRYKLDETPQLLNVLGGTMSFVGPRPQVEWAVNLYNDEEREILKLRPGITDYASIKYRNEGEILKGSTDPDKDYLEKIAPGKMRLELYYVRNYSFMIDLKILIATVLLFVGRNPDWCLPKGDAFTLNSTESKA